MSILLGSLALKSPDRGNAFRVVKRQAMRRTVGGTLFVYDKGVRTYEWDWTVADIVNALLCAGLRIELLGEYDRLFYRRFPSMETEDDRWFQLPALADRLPLLLTLRARKPE